MVTWGPDDGKSILKSCRQREGDKRQVGRQGGHRGVDTEGQKHKPSREENTDQKHVSYTPVASCGPRGQTGRPSQALRCPGEHQTLVPLCWSLFTPHPPAGLRTVTSSQLWHLKVEVAKDHALLKGKLRLPRPRLLRIQPRQAGLSSLCQYSP